MASRRPHRNLAGPALLVLVLIALGWGVWAWEHWGERRQDVSDSAGDVPPPSDAAPGQVTRPDPSPVGAQPADPAQAGANATGDAYRPASERRAVNANTPEERP